MWLTRRLAPDFKTIADFRRDNGAAIRKVCAKFVALCRRMNLFSEAIVAIDGSKFKAVNNRDKNFTVHKLKSGWSSSRRVRPGTWTSWTGPIGSPQVPQVKVQDLKGKISKIREQMATSGPLASSLRGARRADLANRPGCQVNGHQRARYGDRRLQRANGGGHQEPHDRGARRAQRRPRSHGAGRHGQAGHAKLKTKLTVLADRGYFSGEQILACDQDGNSPLVPKPITSAKAEGRFDNATSSTTPSAMPIAVRPASGRSGAGRSKMTVGNSSTSTGPRSVRSARSRTAARPPITGSSAAGSMKTCSIAWRSA